MVLPFSPHHSYTGKSAFSKRKIGAAVGRSNPLCPYEEALGFAA